MLDRGGEQDFENKYKTESGITFGLFLRKGRLRPCQNLLTSLQRWPGEKPREGGKKILARIKLKTGT